MGQIDWIAIDEVMQSAESCGLIDDAFAARNAVDLLRSERDTLRAKVEKLEAAIRQHRAGLHIKADYADRRLWAALGEEEMSSASKPQPQPRPGSTLIVDLVLRDVQERAEAGEREYGTKLMAHNGRDALWDAYQEAIDLAMYLRQAIAERDASGEE